jgi:hypothetical protein
MRIRRAIALVALVALGVVGVNNVTAWPGAQTAAQRLATAVAVGAGVLGLLSAAALWRRAPALGWLLIVWAVATTAAAGLATWAWSEAPARAWLSAAAVGAALGAAVGAFAWSARAR